MPIDDCLTFLTRKLNGAIREPRTHSSIRFRAYNKINRSSFLASLNASNWSRVYRACNVDIAFSLFRDTFMTIFDEHLPIWERIKEISFPWMSNECTEAINVRYELLKTVHRDTKERATWQKYTRARNYATNLVRRTRKQYFSDTIEESKDKPKLLLTHLKRLLPGNHCARWGKN